MCNITLSNLLLLLLHTNMIHVHCWTGANVYDHRPSVSVTENWRQNTPTNSTRNTQCTLDHQGAAQHSSQTGCTKSTVLDLHIYVTNETIYILCYKNGNVPV